MKLLIALSLFIIGCTSTGPLSMKPEDALVPELKFFYWKDGVYKPVYGHAGDVFKQGDVKKFKIKLHKKMKKCHFNYMDGDSHFTKDCKGLSEFVLDQGFYYKDHPSIVSFSVASEKAGIQVGHFYPNLSKKRLVLAVDYRCPHTDTHSNISVCTRPAAFNMILIADVIGMGNGKILYTYNCNDGQTGEQTIDIPGAGQYRFNLTMAQPNYCSIGLFLRQGAMRKSHIVHVRFYNPRYIPLPIPDVRETGDGFEACAPEDYQFYSINGVDQTSWLSGACKTIKGDHIEILVWDGIGRFSWAKRTKTKSGQNFFFFKGKKHEGWDFYKTASLWAVNRILDICDSSNHDCIRDNVDRVLYSEEMKTAVRGWDSSGLSETL